jgi:hypothetical protein
MAIVDLIQQASPWLFDVTTWTNFNHHILGLLPWDSVAIGDVHLSFDLPDLNFGSHHSVLAQTFDTDVFANTRKAFNTFIKSGQAWALLIGLILGYIIRGLTSYG